MSSEYVTQAEAAELIGCKLAEVIGVVRLHGLATLKEAGSSLLISREDLEEHAPGDNVHRMKPKPGQKLLPRFGKLLADFKVGLAEPDFPASKAFVLGVKR